jgi:hypothetical protein
MVGRTIEAKGGGMVGGVLTIVIIKVIIETKDLAQAMI